MVYDRIASLLPKKFLHSFRRELDYLDIEIDEKRFVGFLIVYSFFFSAGIAAIAFFIFSASPIVLFLLFFVLFFGGTFIWLSLAAEARGRFVETILPDTLQLIASNIKSGITAERALLISARKEFGPLEKELRETAKRIIAGQPLGSALPEISKKIKSLQLERTLWLISEGMKSGGQIADLLIELSNSLRQEQALQEEIRADVSIYIILIFSASAFGAPLLFGISSFIVEVLGSKISGFSEIEIGAAPLSGAGGIASSFIRGGTTVISGEFVLFFSMVSLIVTSVFAALTIGVINTGSEKNAAKYLPIILLIALSLFFLVRWFLFSTFGDLVG